MTLRNNDILIIIICSLIPLILIITLINIKFNLIWKIKEKQEIKKILKMNFLERQVYKVKKLGNTIKSWVTRKKYKSNDSDTYWYWDGWFSSGSSSSSDSWSCSADWWSC